MEIVECCPTRTRGLRDSCFLRYLNIDPAPIFSVLVESSLFVRNSTTDKTDYLGFHGCPWGLTPSPPKPPPSFQHALKKYFYNCNPKNPGYTGSVDDSTCLDLCTAIFNSMPDPFVVSCEVACNNCKLESFFSKHKKKNKKNGGRRLFRGFIERRKVWI